MIADDQPLMRDALRTVVGLQPDMVVVAEAADGRDAVAQTLRERPDVAVFDIRMPGLDGIAAAREVTRSVSSKVLILTTFDDDDYVHAALKAGASGFLTKNSPPEDILAAIRVLAGGEALLAPSVTTRLIEHVVASTPRVDAGLAATLQRLTPRELDVLREVAKGLSNAEIGKQLHIGEGTVKTHVSRILVKIGVRDRVQAVIYAYESGLIAPGG
ncbi:response regulator transcription factor [Actinoplanes cyaneus]|uniref:response regulator transcription factor n=1 Tax=Actinoplanes cyaneus TaxID=52696 RepID=UPI0027DD037C|nr:response regulator transcription factor [Actinoplanes cyaneus]